MRNPKEIAEYIPEQVETVSPQQFTLFTKHLSHNQFFFQRPTTPAMALLSIRVRIPLSVALLFILFAKCVRAEPESIMFHLVRGSTQCFTVNANSGSKLHGEVRVVNGKGDMEVGYLLMVGVTNAQLLGKKNIDHERFSTIAPPGPQHGHDEHSTPAEYKLCIYNRAAVSGSQDYRVVHLTFSADRGADEFEDHRGPLEGLATGSNVKEIETTIRQIEHTISNTLDEIDNIRIREGEMFLATDRMAFQMTLMGIIGCVAVTVTGVLQVLQTKHELVKHGDRLLAGSRTIQRDGSKKLSKQGSFVLPSAPKLGRLQSLGNTAILPRHGASREIGQKKT